MGSIKTLEKTIKSDGPVITAVGGLKIIKP